MEIGNLNLTGRVWAAPLAGISNRPFRVLARRGGAAVVFTEMISSEGIIRRQDKTLRLMKFGEEERPIGIQLFGAKPSVMADAAAFVEAEFGPDLIDLNCGCPVPKVVGRNGGAGLLKEPILAAGIMAAVAGAVEHTPVTVKIRTGWTEDAPVYLDLGRAAQEAGLAAVTLHARTRAQGYSGKADWDRIAELKEALAIPVVGNGDIREPADARRMIDATGCDAVMVGRASMGDPFLFGRIQALLATGEDPGMPGIGDRMAVAREHCRLMVAEYGEEAGVKMMRKFLAWYTKGLPGVSKLRPRLFRVETVGDVEGVLAEVGG